MSDSAILAATEVYGPVLSIRRGFPECLLNTRMESAPWFALRIRRWESGTFEFLEWTGSDRKPFSAYQCCRAALRQKLPATVVQESSTTDFSVSFIARPKVSLSHGRLR
jgi:hypothetical protein